VYVLKRPGVDQFLRSVGQKFEVVVFTASLAKYADPLLDILDRSKIIRARLFREACVHHYGNYVKDLSQLGRKLEHTIIIDNSPFSYMFQPDNAIPISSVQRQERPAAVRASAVPGLSRPGGRRIAGVAEKATRVDAAFGVEYATCVEEYNSC